jgi:hypothetical protein
MARPKNEPQRKGNVGVKLDPALVARLDALLPLYALPGREPTRSDSLRAVVLAGLALEERRLAASTSPVEEAELAEKDARAARATTAAPTTARPTSARVTTEKRHRPRVSGARAQRKR